MELRDTILQGDCLTLLRTLPENSVDALVTDPPAGISFMGKSWDADKGGRREWVGWLTEVMSECLRVVKPGGHALVWALPRTSHWTACALEDAGWEIRDCLYHIFGSGFPKSLDVSKAIDRKAGAERMPIRPVATPARNRNGTNALGGGWQEAPWESIPATSEAQTWQGWGTALKPAVECWWLVRKPLTEGTVASNVLAYGTGSVHVDACRVAGADNVTFNRVTGNRSRDQYRTGTVTGTMQHTDQGRWPANLLLSHAPDCTQGTCVAWCPAAVLDMQSGVRKSGSGNFIRTSGKGYSPNTYHAESRPTGQEQVSYGDAGGASRYFAQFYYSAKASRTERDAGLDHLLARSAGEATDREDGTAGLNSPRAGAGRTGGARNHHPTVKPQSLMRWLCRLITPPGGIVLDPFGGSGSTAVAAIAEGFHYLVMEREAEYVPIIEARTTHAARMKTPAPISIKRPRSKTTNESGVQLDLWTA